jgi:hypothetical protein
MGMKAVPCNLKWIHEHSHGSILNFMGSNFNYTNGTFCRMSILLCYRKVSFDTISQLCHRKGKLLLPYVALLVAG